MPSLGRRCGRTFVKTGDCPRLAAGAIAAVTIVALLAARQDLRDGWTGGFLKFSLVFVCVKIWFLTQRMLDARGFPDGGIGDSVHCWTQGANRWLHERPEAARMLLITSSAGIDIFGICLIGGGVLGPSMAPFFALAILFTLRQLSQLLCALPAPEGMIWKHPGFPSLLVTYETRNDFFFSGHTAIAALGAIVAWAELPPAAAAAAVLLAAGEAATVLVLRAHYTMDVICGLLAAAASYFLAAGACRILGL